MKNSKSIVEEYLKKKDWRVNENSNSPFSFGGLNKYITAEVSKDYWLREVYPEHISEAYVDGHIHIHDLGGLSIYTYFGKEVVIIKTPNGDILTTSFEDLYASMSDKEVCVNPKDDVWQIYVSGYKVLDKDGWVDIQKLTRKAKHRDMRFIKNEAGRSIIVTDNHPMITQNGEKESITVVENEDKLFTGDIASLLKDEEKLFSIDKLDLTTILPNKVGKDIIYVDGYPLSQNNEYNENSIVHTQSHSMPRYLHLTKELGFAIGFMLAEGCFASNDELLSYIAVKNKSKYDVDRVCSALSSAGVTSSVSYDGKFYVLRITNKIMLYIIKRYWGIKSGSYHKNIPNQCLMYSRDFLKGVIAGLIDGDGNVNCTTTNIRVAARTMLEQLAILCPFVGIFPRDRRCEGQGSTREFEGKTIVQRYPLYGISFRNMENDFTSSKLKDAKISKMAWRSEEVGTWTKVLTNKPVEIPDEYIYDITTSSHTLLVNGMYNHNCCGFSLRDILLKGVCGVPNIPTSAPAKHFDSALNQLANLTTIFQNEIMGAVAFNSFDTLLAPFIKADQLSYDDVKQSMQNYIFSINSNSRAGAEPAFSNLTFDLTPPSDIIDDYAIVGGDLVSFTYRDCQQEMDMLNKAFFEIMLNGDSGNKLFAYPIPTYNIHDRFDWNNPNNKLLWEMTGKYGTPYFANFLNSDLDISDVRSMCCRLRLDLSELRKRNGGLFGAGDSTGSIGVVTINLPRIAYETKGNKDLFYNELAKYLDIAKESLKIKRYWLQTNIINTHAIPAYIEYVGTLDNHFSTIGVVGMNEMCENFMGKTIVDEEGKRFAVEVGDFIRGKLLDFQEECGCLFNYEATPAESTCYRLALLDKKRYPDIITQGSDSDCYYTNSCHIPVKMLPSINETFAHQEELQTQFSGGTVIHCYLEGAISGEQAKSIVKSMCEKYKVPYMSISPISRYCDEHGYVQETVDKCPICKKKLKLYQRITGYLRCVDNFNKGKKAEFKDRRQIKI